ncbi:MAG: sensor histidine kinase [Syntrophobacteraceae bacterium]|jgi:signal transduction histidine kinase|nr:sensor histidine kinase [Syntrophobacteraceae bacterium]
MLFHDKPWLVRRVGWVGVGLSALYWVIESIMDSSVYELGSLTERLIHPDLNETMMRLLAISLLVGFGFYAQAMIERLAQTEARLTRMNECFFSFGADPVQNIRRLTELTGELLNASAAFYNQLEGERLCLWGQWGPVREWGSCETPRGHICHEVIEHQAQGPRLIRSLESTSYASKDPWITAHRLKTYFGRVVSLGSQAVGSLCAFYDRDVVPDEEEERLTGIIASAIGVEEVRRRAQKKLEDSERQLKLLSSQLLSAQETERKHMAMQLHDSIGQSLSAVKFSIEETLERLKPEVSPEKLWSLESAVTVIREVMREVRAMLKTLRPTMLDDLGILATVNWLCREVETIYTGITLERHTDLDENEIPTALKVPMFRILQEALNNAVKHSRCDHIRVELRQTHGAIEIEISDNGIGMESVDPAGMKGVKGGMGLASMKERAELSGGRLGIESQPGEGTRIRVSWPGGDQESRLPMSPLSRA